MTAPPESRTSSRRQERRSRRTRRIRRAVAVVVVLSALGSWLVVSRSTTGAPASAVASAAVTADDGAAAGPAEATESPAASAADTALAAAVGALDGHFAVTVADPAAGTSAAWGDDSFVTASIVKVDILAALLLQNDGVLTSGQRAAAALM
ncbi:hypothetical protein ACFC6L_37385, partial [Kitasatospora phosalacinea]